MKVEQIERALLEIFSGYDGQLPQESLQGMRMSVEHGERGVALESLCDELLEYDIPVAPVVLARIRAVGEAMGISPDYWERLTLVEPQ